MKLLDRLAVGGTAGAIALVPLFGVYGSFDPLRPPIVLLGGTRAAVAVGIATAISGLFALAGSVLRRPAAETLGPGLACVAATFLASACGFDPVTGMVIALTTLCFFAVHRAIFAYYRVPGVAAALYATLFTSGALGALAAVLMLLTRHPVALYALNRGRAVGTFLNPNELAAYLLVYLAAAGGIALTRPGTPLGRCAAACALLGSVALVGTFSRWGLVSALAGLALFAAVTRLRGAAVAVVATLVLGLAANLAFGARVHDPQDTDARAVAWRAGLATFAHFPLIGVGPLAFGRLYPIMRAPDAPGPNTPIAFDPHSLPLAVLAESGTLGFAAIVWFGVALVRGLRRRLRVATPSGRILALANGAGLFALTVHSLLNSVSIVFLLAFVSSALTLCAARWGFGGDALV
jgi:O-antigen ligase